MILGLLDYSRVGHDEKQEHALIDLAKVLEHVKLNLSARIQESGAVITHSVLPEVEGNFARLVQLFQNLIENAIKYRGEGTPRIQITADRKEADCTFCISDNGIGIEPQYAEEIFGVFRRLHGSEYEGTGIGLALCKKIVERLGGRIWVESKPGDGAEFYFVIPMLRQADATSTAAVAEHSREPFKALRSSDPNKPAFAVSERERPMDPALHLRSNRETDHHQNVLSRGRTRS